MFYEELIEIGDILLYENADNGVFGNCIKFFSNGGKYVHSAIYSGRGRIIESHIETGVVEKQLNPKWYKIIDIYRIHGDLTQPQKKQLIEYMKAHEIGKGYDLAAFPSTFFRSTVATIFGFRNFSKSRPILNDDGHRFCSELVGAAYMNALGRDISPTINFQSLTPSDIGRSQLLRKIC